MTLSYLSQTHSGVVDGSGKATILFLPDTGQFWLPTVVHVGTRAASTVQCSLNMGGIAALTDRTTRRDFTYQGSNDTSTILSGTIVHPGERIACNFVNGVPGDIVVADIAGLSSDVPPTAGIVPDIPGARFIGAANIGLQNSMFYNPPQFTINSAGSSNLTPSTFLLFTNFGSYNMFIDSGVVGAATGDGVLQIEMSWYSIQNLNQVIYDEYYEVFPNSISGTYTAVNCVFYIQDIVHADFLVIRLRNGGPDQIFVNLELTATPNVVPRRYVGTFRRAGAMQSGVTGALDQSLLIAKSSGTMAANAFDQSYLAMAPGPCSIHVTTVSQTFTMFLFAPSGAIINKFLLAANAEFNANEIMFPRSMVRAQLQNTGAGNGNFSMQITTGRDNW